MDTTDMELSNIFSRRNRILLRELVMTDFKLRYQGSILGYLWSLLKPLMLFAILYVVFIHFMRFGDGSDHFAVQLLLGIVLWSFFVEATMQGMSAIVARGDLIRKINFPKYIIVVSGTISALINLLLNLVVVFVFIVANGVQISWEIIWFPLAVLELYVFALAIAFLLSALYVKFRDISHIWEVVMQGMFYATPVLFPITIVAGINSLAAKILMLNPLAQIIQDARYASISKNVITTWSYIENTPLKLVPFAIVALTVVFATYYFKKNQKYFAENI